MDAALNQNLFVSNQGGQILGQQRPPDYPQLVLTKVLTAIFFQQFENHLIYPLVVKKIIGVPPITVILALIIGAQLGGFLGFLISVPIAALLMEYLDDVQKRKIAVNS
mgnify:CR=1 FL=1